MRKTSRTTTAGQPILLKADGFYTPMVALTVSLQGPASPRVLSHLTI